MANLSDLATHLRVCKDNKSLVTITVEYLGQKAFPATGVISEVVGHKVKLRLVNDSDLEVDLTQILQLEKHVPGEAIHPAVKNMIDLLASKQNS